MKETVKKKQEAYNMNLAQEKPDSVIVIPAHDESFVAPKQYYRPGVNINTYGFPGGRLDAGTTITDATKAILKRELDIEASDISIVHQLNTDR